MPEYVEFEGGNIPVYTGPKGGKFVVRNGHKVYLNRKTLNDTIKYTKKTSNKKRTS
jgi:hypothetical protein